MRNVDPSPLGSRLLDGVQNLRDPPALLEVTVSAAVLGDRVQPFVNLDRLQLVHAEGHAGERPERAVVTMAGAELDLAVTLRADRISGEEQGQGMDVLLDELECPLATHQLDALVPGAAGRHPWGPDVAPGTLGDLEQKGCRVVVLDRVAGSFQVR